MSDRDWLWGQPNVDPGTHEFGPGLPEAEIARWETRSGVALPEVLRRAYRQQNGGLLRSEEMFLYRLEELEPVSDDYFEALSPEPTTPLDTNLAYELGYDDPQGTSLILYYGEGEPVILGYWGDGGTIAYRLDRPEDLLKGSPRPQR